MFNIDETKQTKPRLRKQKNHWAICVKITNNFCVEKLNILSNRLKMGTNKCPKAAEPLRGGSFLFITKFPKIPVTHLMDPRKMKG